MQEILRIGVSKVVSFHRCAMNEYNSIVNRHVKTQLPCTEAATKLMFNSINSLLYAMRFVDLSPMTIGSVIESRPQRMRKRYKNVMSQSPDPGMGKSFIKFEKLEDKDNLIPRLIQYRSSAYTLQLARYTIVVEKALSMADQFYHNGGFPIIAKGKNAAERGSLLYEMWGMSGAKTAHLYDHSKFDSMVNETHWELEQYVMGKLFNSKKLMWLYSKQQCNKFLSQCGIKYQFPYRRCSGDANTSVGNSLINYAILRAQHPKGLILVDGDDSVVFDNSQAITKFEDFGMVTKHETVNDFQKVEFCQSRPVLTPVGWVMCRNPLRAISRMNVRLGPAIKQRDWFWTVGVGEGLTSAYMPIISYMAKRFRKLGAGGKVSMWLLDNGERYRLRTSMFLNKFELPNDSTRASFAAAWDIEPDLQRVYEQAIMTVVLQ